MLWIGVNLSKQNKTCTIFQCFWISPYSKNIDSCHTFLYYNRTMIIDMVSNDKPISWFTDFIGVGYRYHDVYMNVIPLFSEKVPAYRLWKKTIDWWPDNEIKLRFVEQSDNYWLIIYGGSTYKDDNTGFVKKVQVSDNYKRFKSGYEKKVILRFGIYKENLKRKDENKNYDLEILKKSKSIYDIAFFKYEDLSPKTIEWQCIEENK
jgi:hypothetical protein